MVTDTRSQFSKRLNELCDEKGLPPKGQGRQLAVARLFGVSQKGARKWLEGEAMPETSRMPKFTAIFDCNIDWLLAGRGAKRDTYSQAPALTPRQRALIYESLTEAQQEEFFTDQKLPLAEAAKLPPRKSPGALTPLAAPSPKRGALPDAPPLASKKGPSVPDPDALRLAEAIQSLPPESRAHLQAVTRAFTESQAVAPWDGKTERRKGGKR